MRSVTVTEPKELKKAIEAKYDEIVVTGKLAKKVKKARKIKKLSPVVLCMIAALIPVGTATVATAPATGGGSMALAFAAYTAASTASGVSISVLLIITSVGLAALSILFDEYTHIEVNREKIIFERKHKGKGKEKDTAE